jgi:hypothetical protein
MKKLFYLGTVSLAVGHVINIVTLGHPTTNSLMMAAFIPILGGIGLMVFAIGDKLFNKE